MRATEGSHPVLWEPVGINDLVSSVRRSFLTKQQWSQDVKHEKSSADKGEMGKEEHFWKREL